LLLTTLVARKLDTLTPSGGPSWPEPVVSGRLVASCGCRESGAHGSRAPPFCVLETVLVVETGLVGWCPTHRHSRRRFHAASADAFEHMSILLCSYATGFREISLFPSRTVLLCAVCSAAVSPRRMAFADSAE